MRLSMIFFYLSNGRHLLFTFWRLFPSSEKGIVLFRVEKEMDKRSQPFMEKRRV